MNNRGAPSTIITVFLVLSTLLLLVTLSSPTQAGISISYPSNSSSSTNNTTVKFLQGQEYEQIKKEIGSFTTPLSNSTQGNASNIKAASDGRTMYISWLGKVDTINHLFLSISSNGGLNFSEPIELSPPNTGNISNVQIFADRRAVALAWQATNTTTGINSIFFSRSYDYGGNFTTIRLTDENVNARGPVLLDEINVAWIETVNETSIDPADIAVRYYWRWN
jgi:hypothetical protein